MNRNNDNKNINKFVNYLIQFFPPDIRLSRKEEDTWDTIKIIEKIYPVMQAIKKSFVTLFYMSNICSTYLDIKNKLS